MKKTNLPHSHLPIICLCGSAGALGAYQQILGQLALDSDVAIVLVSHRGPGNPELLASILGKATKLEIVEAADGLKLRANCIFLSPPHMDLTTDGIILSLQKCSKDSGWPNVIDLFLTSLADSGASGSFAVILSGMGFDGSGALKAFKKSGGLIFAQSDALREHMPEAAVQTGYVDFFLSAQEIGKRLADIAPPPGSRLA